MVSTSYLAKLMAFGAFPWIVLPGAVLPWMVDILNRWWWKSSTGRRYLMFGSRWLEAIDGRR